MNDYDTMFLPDPKFDEGILVDRPSLLTKTRRFTEWSTSIVSWVLWFFALRPLLMLALWSLGFQMTYAQIVEKESWRNSAFFDRIFLAVACAVTVMLAFHLYMKLRYFDRPFVYPKPRAKPDMLAAYYGFDEKEFARIQKSRRVDAYFHPDHALELRGDNGAVVHGLFNPQNFPEHFALLHRKHPEIPVPPLPT